MTHDRNNHDTEVSLARKVGRMGMLIHRYYDVQATRHGGFGDPLRGQGRVLALLKVKPETTQRELSFLLDMRQQSLSELLGKLEDKGYITREKSPEDGRVTVVHLTDAGAEAAPSSEQMQEQADALDCLSEEERTQLETLTDKVTSSIEGKLEAMGIDPHRPPHGPHDSHGHGPHDSHGHGKGRGGRGGGRGRGGQGQGGEEHGPHGYGGNRGPHGPYRPRNNDRDDHQMRQANTYKA